MCQQRWGRQAACNRTAERFRLYDGVTFDAAQFRSNMPDNFESGGHVLEHFRNIFTEFAPVAAACRTVPSCPDLAAARQACSNYAMLFRVSQQIARTFSCVCVVNSQTAISGFPVRAGCRQSIPSNSMDNCAR